MKYLLSVLCGCCFTMAAAQPAWQQRVDTRLDVRLDDEAHMLHAFGEFTYVNNSPDTLRYIYVHLWMNAYKHDRTPFAKQQDRNGSTEFYYSKKQDRGYIDSLQFSVDGTSVEYFSTDDVPDIARIELPQPLLPGGSVKVATPFRVKLPKVFSRNGHTGQAYYVSQWFPKPAVYDQKGWHPISYLDQGEFYSEYGSYDVAITLPANYVLMATGNCLDAHENDWLDSLSRLPMPADTLYNKGVPASDYKTKTVHFHEDNVHDFAWFADKRFVVRKDTVTSPGNGQVVTTWAGFLPAYQDSWKNATNYLATAVRHYGKWVGPYPYKTIKAVVGDMKAGGGMEYPTITLIARTASSGLKTVIVHEAGHNWFYGLLGSNERDHAWMDEGLNTFYEQKTIQEGKRDSGFVSTGLDESLIYYQFAATHTDQPIELTSNDFGKIHYGIDVYYKTALVMRWLEAYMGKAAFEDGMKDYFDTWKYHHPYPADFAAIMSRHTSKSLNWFFDTIMHTDDKIDFTATKARVSGTGTTVTVANRTGVWAPAHVQAYDGDSVVADAWTEPFSGKTNITLPATGWNRLLVSRDVPDARSANNVYRRGALFPHFRLRLKPVLGINRSAADKIFLAPALGQNFYDGIMAGPLLHNLTLPANRLRFALAPMYAFTSHTLVGSGSVGYTWYPGNALQEITLQADAKSYSYLEATYNTNQQLYGRYIKMSPYLEFVFNQHDQRSPVTRFAQLKGYSIREDNFAAVATPGEKPAIVRQQLWYGRAWYQHTNDRAYNPFSYSLDVHGNADFIKVALEGNIRIDYNVKNKGLHVRAFAGKFIALNNDPAAISRYYLNASYGGINDYLYDGTYRGRNTLTGFSAQHISMQEGGFKIPVHSGVNRSDDWMATLNLATDLPLGKIPLRLFFDAGLLPNNNKSVKNINNRTLIYDGGVELVLSPHHASIYFPFIMSGDFRDYLSGTFGSNKVLARSFSFTLQLQDINWLRFPEKALKQTLK